MERKRLIRPVTILKVKNYMNEVYAYVKTGRNFSLDELAREHSISGSNGTALLRDGFILPTDVKGSYTIPEGDPGVATDYSAKMLIESVRLSNSKSTKTEKSQHLNVGGQGDPEIKIYPKDVQEHELNKKGLKSPEFASILEKIFVKVNEGKQSDLFDGISNVHNERVHVASHVASAVWNLPVEIMDKQKIHSINRKIVEITDDLMDQILNFKKVNK